MKLQWSGARSQEREEEEEEEEEEDVAKEEEVKAVPHFVTARKKNTITAVTGVVNRTMRPTCDTIRGCR